MLESHGKDRVQFTAYGEPRPKGSFKPFTIRRKDGRIGAGVTNDNPHTSSWQQIVGYAARAAGRGVYFPAGVSVGIEAWFIFVRPKSAPARKRPFMTVKPDQDKLSRALMDSLTGVLYEDDSQVTFCQTEKLYADQTTTPQARVEVVVWRREC